MKATGIVRRIDDLGRVVIPKEIRRTLHIREGDPLEIYTEKDGEVIFKKYSPMGDLQNFAVQMCDAIGKNTGHIAAVSDRDSIIALAGAPRRELLDKPNSADLDQIMERRKCYRYTPGSAKLRAAETADRYHLGIAAPIVSQGDLMGCVMLLIERATSGPPARATTAPGPDRRWIFSKADGELSCAASWPACRSAAFFLHCTPQNLHILQKYT